MTPEQIDKLRPLALHDPMLHALVQLWDFDVAARPDWPLVAIGALARRGRELQDRLVDAEMKRTPAIVLWALGKDDNR
jgi:hypothetical protein